MATHGEDVEVKFGASIAGLTAGINRVKEEIESLRNPIEAFVSSLSGIAEALGAAFVVEKIAEFAEKMSELGEHAVNMGAALNMSAEAFNNLSGAMAIVGGNADSLVRGFRTLQNAVQAAQSNPESRQGFAFRQLGLDANAFAEILRTKPEEALDILAEKIQGARQPGWSRRTVWHHPRPLVPGIRQGAEERQGRPR
jgi:hypothetical protein